MEKLVLAGQSILTLIADLKRDALLSDFPAMNKLIESKNSSHEQVRLEAEEQIQQLLTQRALEVSYATTLCR